MFTHTSFRIHLLWLCSGNLLRLNRRHELWFLAILFVTFVVFHGSVWKCWNSHRSSVVNSNIQCSLLRYLVWSWRWKDVLMKFQNNYTVKWVLQSLLLNYLIKVWQPCDTFLWLHFILFFYNLSSLSPRLITHSGFQLATHVSLLAESPTREHTRQI